LKIESEVRNSASKISGVVPDKRALASADPGPITPGRGFAEGVYDQRLIERSRGMGPGVGRDDIRAHTGTSCSVALPARFGFFTFAGPNSEPAASPAMSATQGSRETIAATMAPSINSAS
jgi:hypothetical protein